MSIDSSSKEHSPSADLNCKNHYRNLLPFVLVLAVTIHFTFLVSIISEPFQWVPGINMTGSKTHPQECDEFSGFLDSFFHDADRVPRGLDFFSIYQAGYNFLHGYSVYYGVREHEFGDEVLVVPYFSGFRYLPSYAYIFGSILNCFRPWPSYWFWIVCVESMLFLNIWALWLIPVNKHIRILASIMWLAYTPYYIELHIGQQSMVTATALHLTGLLHLRSRNKMRDTCYIFSVLWKLNTLLFIPIWLKYRRIRSIGILFFLILIFSVPYFCSTPGSFREFFSYFHLKFIPTGPNSLGLWSLFGTVWQRIIPGNEQMMVVLNLISWVFLIFASLITLLPRKINFIHALGLWTCVYFLTYQYVWEHHYVMLLPVFSLLMLVDKSKIWMAIWFLCAIPTPYILFNNPALDMPQLQWTASQDIFYHSTKIIPVLLMFVILAWKMFSNRNDTESDQYNFAKLFHFFRFSRETSIEQH